MTARREEDVADLTDGDACVLCGEPLEPDDEIVDWQPADDIPDSDGGRVHARHVDARREEDVEALAAEFHRVYQEEARRQGDVRHQDAYEDLPENIKEFDRVLARHVIAEVARLSGERDALNSENTSLNAENRDLIQKWSARGADVERLREPLLVARTVFAEVSRLVLAGKPAVAMLTLDEFQKAIDAALSAGAEQGPMANSYPPEQDVRDG